MNTCFRLLDGRRRGEEGRPVEWRRMLEDVKIMSTAQPPSMRDGDPTKMVGERAGDDKRRSTALRSACEPCLYDQVRRRAAVAGEDDVTDCPTCGHPRDGRSCRASVEIDARGSPSRDRARHRRASHVAGSERPASAPRVARAVLSGTKHAAGSARGTQRNLIGFRMCRVSGGPRRPLAVSVLGCCDFQARLGHRGAARGAVGYRGLRGLDASALRRAARGVVGCLMRWVRSAMRRALAGSDAASSGVALCAFRAPYVSFSWSRACRRVPH